MSFLDKVIDSVKDIDLTPTEKYAESAYHNAAGTVQGALGTKKGKARSAYHNAMSTVRKTEGDLADTFDGVGEYFERTDGKPDYVRGFVAGMIGGLIGTGIKMVVDRSLPTAQPNEERGARLEVVDAAEDATDTNISYSKEQTAQQALNIAFGGLVGGVYGVLVEAMPAIQAPAGVPFGAALWTVAHKVALPALGLTPGPMNEPLSLQAGQLGSHMAYGASVEMVRRSVRHVMDEENIL